MDSGAVLVLVRKGPLGISEPVSNFWQQLSLCHFSEANVVLRGITQENSAIVPSSLAGSNHAVAIGLIKLRPSLRLQATKALYLKALKFWSLKIVSTRARLRKHNLPAHAPIPNIPPFCFCSCLAVSEHCEGEWICNWSICKNLNLKLKGCRAGVSSNKEDPDIDFYKGNKQRAISSGAELKVTHLRWRSPICGKPFPAVFYENLRFSAKICVLGSLSLSVTLVLSP